MENACMKVLLAEDDKVSRVMLEKHLQAWGYEFVSTTNGSEAWNVIRQDDHPQIAILDWMMPEIDGITLCNMIRRTYLPDYIYIIILTARDTKEDIVEGINAGADDYLIKPFHHNELKTRILSGERVIRLENELAGRIKELKIMQDKFNNLIKRYVSTATYDTVMEHVRGIPASEATIRDMTVLYLDVVDFTGFSERHTPEKVAKMLNDVFGICEVITRECVGDIDKFIGDAIMAVFVEPNDAIAAGLKILAALLPFNQSRTEMGQEEIRIRIGINSGLLMHAEIGTSDRRDMTVIGDVVNAASRIESTCEPMRMCISEATYSRLNNPEKFKPYKTVKVKNRDEPVSMYINK
jgi:class 3 adenylate cyclase/FixJ family two-component response regulator